MNPGSQNDWMLRRIIGRLHVGESNLAVIRYCLSRLRKGAFRKMKKPLRRQFLQSCIRIHADNRALYLRVMGGGL